MRAFPIAIFTIALSAPLAAQWLNQPTPGIPRTRDGKPNLSAPAPRTPDGTPDLSGLWRKISPKYARNIAADLKPGDIPPSVRALVEQRKEELGKDHMRVHCLPLGPGYVTAADANGSELMKIVQTPGVLLILNPDLTYRQVFLDGRTLEESPNPAWMGYSVGRWEKDTLVVESFGFHERTWLDQDGHPHTEALRVTERYRRRDFGNLEVEVTLSDPAMYARPWTVAVRAEIAADTEMLEWVCTENNRRPLENWVGKASDERKGEAQVAPEILATYAGMFLEQRPFWRTVPRVVEITVSDGRLFGDMDGSGKAPLIALTDTSFSGLNGLSVEFIDGGSSLLVKHVSGNYRFARK